MSQLARVIGCGAYLPERIMTNAELEQMVETNDEWIRTRTGITQRHIAAEGELTSDMAIAASQQALKAAKLEASEIDLIIVATTTPDNTFPATAGKVQAELGANKAAVFDMQAVCAGFVYALATADSLLKTGIYKNALVIGADMLSKIVDWTDRTTCILFGDGAGAVVLQSEKGDKGILSSHLASDGTTRDLLYTDGGVSSTKTAGFIHMQGREVFKHAVSAMRDSVLTALERAHLKKEAINWLIPHQANQRILSATGKKLGIPESKLISTVSHHGNTSAASIPLALADAVSHNRIQPGDIVALTAIGGGLSWGSVILRW